MHNKFRTAEDTVVRNADVLKWSEHNHSLWPPTDDQVTSIGTSLKLTLQECIHYAFSACCLHRKKFNRNNLFFLLSSDLQHYTHHETVKKQLLKNVTKQNKFVCLTAYAAVFHRVHFWNLRVALFLPPINSMVSTICESTSSRVTRMSP